jgi:uncharacterized repeat protein (TIGR03803 family)
MERRGTITASRSGHYQRSARTVDRGCLPNSGKLLAAGPGGGNPSALPADPEGNLYGTTLLGGAAGEGVVFKLDTSGRETVLHTFTGGTDGGEPEAGVIRDSGGNLYGTTFSGGAAGAGVVYMLSPSGQETVLYSFAGLFHSDRIRRRPVPFASISQILDGSLP